MKMTVNYTVNITEIVDGSAELEKALRSKVVKDMIAKSVKKRVGADDARVTRLSIFVHEEGEE